MHVIGACDQEGRPRVDVEGCPNARPANCVAQYIDLLHQQIRTTVEQVDGEEVRSARNAVAAGSLAWRECARAFGTTEGAMRPGKKVGSETCYEVTWLMKAAAAPRAGAREAAKNAAASRLTRQ